LSALLNNLFQPTELVNIVCDSVEIKTAAGKTKHNPKGYGETKSAADWMVDVQSNGVPQGDAGAWLRMNPLDGKGVADKNVAAFRFALVESDILPLDLQLSLGWWLRAIAPIAAVTTSGGRSIQYIVAVNAANEAEYDGTVAQLLALLQPYGADQSNKNPSRLSRLPGAIRRLGCVGDGHQRLLYCERKRRRRPWTCRRCVDWRMRRPE